MARARFFTIPLSVLVVGVVAGLGCPGPVDGNEGGEGEGSGGEGEGEGAGEGEGEGGAGEGEGEGGAGEGEGEGGGGEGEGEGSAGDFGPYDVDGPDTVTTAELSVTTDQGHTFTELVFVPSSPGPHPVVSLSPGLLQPAVAYTSFGLRLASHGIVMIARDDPGVLTNTTDVTADIVYTVTTWLHEQAADSTSPLFGIVDTANVGLAGHSRGGKASLIAAEHGLLGHIVGWFGLDPVDADTLAGNSFALTDLGSVAVPTVFLGAEVVSSCSPANSTSGTLFPAAPSPSVFITGKGAGHTQLEDADHCFVCAACSPGGTADDAVVIRYADRYLAAFFARELLGDTTVAADLSGAGSALDVAAGNITLETK